MSHKKFLVLMVIAITLLATVACGGSRPGDRPEAETVAEPVGEQTTTQVEANEAAAEAVEVVEAGAPATDAPQPVEAVAETASASEPANQQPTEAVEVVEVSAAPAEAWQAFTSEAGNFTVRFPQEPVEQTQNAAGAEMHSFIVDLGASAYMVMYNEFPAELVNNDLLAGMLEQFFGEARDGMLASIDGVLTAEEDFTFEGYPGRRIEFDVADGRLPGGGLGVILFYFIGNRLYQVGGLTGKGQDSAEDIETFLASFNLLDPAAVAEMEPADTAGADPVTAPSYDTVFPLPETVQNFTSQHDDSQGINFQTDLTLAEAMSFYRQQFVAQGLLERELLTVTSDTTFSMVFDGAENGKALVIQGVIIGEMVNLNIRFEAV